MIKLIAAISHTLPDFPSFEPSLLPSGCIDISAPMVKIAKPAIRQSTPKRNIKKVPGLSGVNVTLSASTMAAMGRMDVRDSLNLLLITFSKSLSFRMYVRFFLPVYYIILSQKKHLFFKKI